MIIEARGDVVTLRGRLSENHWQAIAAAVDLLLPDHPQGILMDCHNVESMTDMGGATFIEGLGYMETRGARIILCQVPPPIVEQLRSIPGLHSQVPTALTLEMGRQSLGAAGAAPLTSSGRSRVVLVPVNPPFSLDAVYPVLGRFKLDGHTELHFVHAMLVPRSLPLGAPLPEEESRAEGLLAQAERVVSAPDMRRHLVRGRNVPDALVDAARKLGAAEIIAGLSPEVAEDEEVGLLIQALRNRTPCAFMFVQEPAH